MARTPKDQDTDVKNGNEVSQEAGFGYDIPVPVSVASKGIDEVKRYRKAKIEERDNLVKILSQIRAVRLNTPKRLLYCITSRLDGGEVLLNLSVSNRVAVFGESGVSKIKDLPIHGLKSLYEALSRNWLIDISTSDPGSPKKVDNRPKIEKETTDPLSKLNPQTRNRLVTVLNSKDSSPNTPANGNTLDNILEYIKNKDNSVIECLISLEYENRNRLEVINALREELDERVLKPKEKKLLDSLK